MFQDKALGRRLEALGIRKEDLQESFSRSSGPGGQHVNKTSTAATVRHRPSGTAVTASDSRSQSANRRLAVARLLAILENRASARRQARLAAVATARRRRARRSSSSKAELVRGKRRRAETKQLRGRVSPGSKDTD